MNEALFEMFGRGFDVAMGPHISSMSGFYAQFYRVEPGFENPPSESWSQVGHGLSLEDAVRMARAIALKEPVEIPLPESFEE